MSSGRPRVYCLLDKLSLTCMLCLFFLPGAPALWKAVLLMQSVYSELPLSESHDLISPSFGTQHKVEAPGGAVGRAVVWNQLLSDSDITLTSVLLRWLPSCEPCFAHSVKQKAPARWATSQEILLATLGPALSRSKDAVSHSMWKCLGHSEACVRAVVQEMTLNPFRGSLGWL